MAAIQNFKRITNPYMPNGTAAQTNAPSPAYAPGEIGCAFTETTSGRSYLRVYLDSGATNATPVGAVAAGQLAFWKDPLNNIVTNDQRFAVDVAAPGNCVAGIFQNAVTAAPGINQSNGQPQQYYTDLVIEGFNVPVASSGSGGNGQIAVADTTAATARVSPVAVGTAPGYKMIGVMRGAPASGLVNVDVQIGFIS